MEVIVLARTMDTKPSAQSVARAELRHKVENMISNGGIESADEGAS